MAYLITNGKSKRVGAAEIRLRMLGEEGAGLNTAFDDSGSSSSSKGGDPSSSKQKVINGFGERHISSPVDPSMWCQHSCFDTRRGAPLAVQEDCPYFGACAETFKFYA